MRRPGGRRGRESRGWMRILAGALLLLATPWEAAAARAVAVADWRGFEKVEDLSVVALDLSIALSASAPVRLTYESGRSEFLQSCGYGGYDGVRIVEPSPPGTHLLVDIRPGTPEAHPANAVFCEYVVGRAKVVGEGFLTLSGCYLARVFSIPTARQVSLRPLGPEACGWAR